DVDAREEQGFTLDKRRPHASRRVGRPCFLCRPGRGRRCNPERFEITADRAALPCGGDRSLQYLTGLRAHRPAIQAPQYGQLLAQYRQLITFIEAWSWRHAFKDSDERSHG